MQTTKPNLLELDPPNELVFKGPFNQVVSSHIKLVNTSEKKICFKVKTTAPRRYCVRPNNGILWPKSSVEILLKLQPVDIAEGEKTKHKFMVQSLVIPEGSTESLDHLWKNAAPSDLMYAKLRCSFEHPGGQKLSSEAISRACCPPTTQMRSQASEKVETGAFEDETRRLKADVDNLRLENRRLMDVHSKLSTAIANNSDQQSRNSVGISLYPSIVYVVFALIIGYFLGKFVV